MKFLPFSRIGAVAATLGVVASADAQQDILWNSGVTGDYLTPGNWEGGQVPPSGDRAIINNGHATLDAASASALQLRVGAAGGTGTFTMSNGASFATAEAPGGDLLVGDGGTGTATITDSTFTVGRWLKVGLGGGTGTLILNGSTEMELDRRPVQDPPLAEDEVWIGGDAAGSTGTLSLANTARLTSYSNIYIGVNNATAEGTLDLSGTSEILADGGNNFFIGTGGATGNATLSGGSRIEKINTIEGATGVFAVGNIGGSQGFLTVQDNAEIHSGGEFWIGNDGGTGTVTMEGGEITVDNWFAIGRAGGNGTLEMSGGTLELSGAVAGGNFTTAATNAASQAVIEHEGGTIRNTVSDTYLSEDGNTFWTASGSAVGEFGRFVVNEARAATATALFTIEGSANYTATTLVVNGGGTVNFDGGTFTAESLNVEKGNAGVATVNFNGGTVNIPRIQIHSGAFLDTTTPFTVTAGRTLAGMGAGTATMMQNVTVNAGGTLSTHDTEIGTFTMQEVSLASGAALEFDLNGALATHDQILVAGLTANGTIELTLNNLGGDTLQTGVAYTLMSGGAWAGTATFDIEALGGLVLDESFGTDGYLFDATAGTLSVQFAAIPEPGTVVLLAGGLAFAAWRLRRRKV